MSIVLVTLADSRYLEAAKQLFASAHFAGGWKGDYLLLAHDIPEEETEEFVQRGIRVRHVAPLLRGTVGSLPATTVSKLYLFDDFFKQWERVLYLDADIIVRASLSCLPQANAPFQAVRDLCDLRDQFSFPGDKIYPHDGAAFNTGVMLFETSINSAAVFDDLRARATAHAPYARFGDQSILNDFFHGRWGRLPTDCNGYAHLRAFGFPWPVFRGASILHFACKPKPWDCTGSCHDEWNHYRAQFDTMQADCRQKGKVWSGGRLAFNRFMRALRFRISRLDTWVGKMAAKIRPWMQTKGRG